MRKFGNRHLAVWATALAVGMAWCLFWPPAVLAAEKKAPGPAGFDRAALREELARPVPELQKQGADALKAHVRRLTDLYSGLETAADIPPSERRALSDHILGRVAQVSLLLRGEQTGAAGVRAKDGPSGGVLAIVLRATDALSDNSLLLIGLVGGLIVVFALGNLAGYRRGSRHASYYGYAEGDPRIRFVARGLPEPDGAKEIGRVTLQQIREHLLAGRTVMLQLGYEVSPEHRGRYLELVRGMRQAMGRLDGGQSYAVWEDPRHANRFYEVLTCQRLSTLERLLRYPGELGAMAAGIEACRVPRRPVLRRTWWGVVPEPGENGRPPRAETYPRGEV
jgi:hypothetical protein